MSTRKASKLHQLINAETVFGEKLLKEAAMFQNNTFCL
jgi:hypothetical protein